MINIGVRQMRNFNDLSDFDKGVALVRDKMRTRFYEHKKDLDSGVYDNNKDKILICRTTLTTYIAATSICDEFLDVATLGEIEIDYSNIKIRNRTPTNPS
jgi:hypothetical protein